MFRRRSSAKKQTGTSKEEHQNLMKIRTEIIQHTDDITENAEHIRILTSQIGDREKFIENLGTDYRDFEEQFLNLKNIKKKRRD